MDITIDNSDNLYCSGNISANSITGLTNVLEFFDNLIGTTKTIASGDTALNEDTLVFKLSNDGAVVFREIIDASNGEEACHSIHYNNNIILCGGFKSYKVDGDLINKDISVLGFGAFEDPTYFTADDVKIDSNTIITSQNLDVSENLILVVFYKAMLNGVVRLLIWIITIINTVLPQIGL